MLVSSYFWFSMVVSFSHVTDKKKKKERLKKVVMLLFNISVHTYLMNSQLFIRVNYDKYTVIILWKGLL